MILALYKPQNRIVRVLDAIADGARKYALVETLDGSEPFTRYTMGGPMDTDSALVFADQLAGVTMIEAPDAAAELDKQLQAAREARNRHNVRHNGEYIQHPRWEAGGMPEMNMPVKHDTKKLAGNE